MKVYALHIVDVIILYMFLMNLYMLYMKCLHRLLVFTCTFDEPAILTNYAGHVCMISEYVGG